MSNLTEETICQESVYKRIFQQYSRDLYRFLYYKYGSENQPADLVQEAFIKLWENCGKVPVEKAKAFLFTVANNQMLNALARKKTVLKHRSLSVHTAAVESPEFLVMEEEYRDALQSAIEALPEGQRVAFLLNRVEGKKHREIAEMLGISQKSVEKRIYSALASISEKVGKM